MYFRVKSIFQESNAAVENVAFPHTLWSNGSSLIDLSCLFKLQWDLPVPLCQMPQCTQISHWLENTLFLPATALDSIIVNQEHMASLAPATSLPCPLLPPLPPLSPYQVPHTHTHSLSRFLSPSLQIRAAEVYCYFIKTAAAMGGPRSGWLPCEWGIIIWPGDTSWSSPIFLIEGFNTSYRETAVLQISTFSVTLTNVLLGLCRGLTVSKALCSCPPSQHRHLNHQTHTFAHILNLCTCQKRQGNRGSCVWSLCLIIYLSFYLAVAKVHMHSVVQHNIYCWETAVRYQVTDYELNLTSLADWFKSLLKTKPNSVCESVNSYLITFDYVGTHFHCPW